MPNGKYNGQKLMRLVTIKIPERTNKMMATVPEMIPLK
jgi:hypothetical protein